MVVCLAVTKFEPFIAFVLSFVLTLVAIIYSFITLHDFCLLPA